MAHSCLTARRCAALAREKTREHWSRVFIPWRLADASILASDPLLNAEVDLDLLLTATAPPAPAPFGIDSIPCGIPLSGCVIAELVPILPDQTVEIVDHFAVANG